LIADEPSDYHYQVILSFWTHEEKVYDYVAKNKIDKLLIGYTEFKITLDSFRLVELDIDELNNACTVCNEGLNCKLRIPRAIRLALFRELAEVYPLTACYAIDDALNF